MLEISKAQRFTSSLPSFFEKGLKTPVGTMEMLLQMTKDIFKAEKVTFFAVDASL